MQRISFTFKEPLAKIIFYQGQNVTQYEILECDVNGIREKIRKELNKVLKSINVIRWMNASLFTALQYRVDSLNHQLNMFVDFRKIDDLHYVFIFPSDLRALFTIKNFSEKLGPLAPLMYGKLKNQDLEIAKVLRTKELVDAFQKFSFVEMHLAPTDYEIVVDEFDTDPEPEPPKPEQTVVVQQEVTSVEIPTILPEQPKTDTPTEPTKPETPA